MTRTLFLLIGAAMALAGCSREPEPVPTGSDGPVAGSTAVVPAPTPLATASVPAPSLELPQPMHGRFGLVPGDCTSTRGDAKGLLVVTGDGLRFYESFARLAEVEQNTPRRVAATLAFTGEGMEWQRKATLTLDPSGNTLVLRETGEGAMDGPLTYTRCPA